MAGQASQTKVQRGSRCNNTAAVQNALNVASVCEPSLKLGQELKVDGIFGDKTEAAVRKLQTVRRLQRIDGVVGNETGAHLFEPGELKRKLTLTLPPGTGLPAVLPNTSLDAEALLQRRRYVDIWSEAARAEKTGIAVPKLRLPNLGLDPKALNAAGIATEVAEHLPFAGPFVRWYANTDAKSLQVTVRTASFSQFEVVYSVPTVQPKWRPYFTTESKVTRIDGGLSATSTTSWTPATGEFNLGNLITGRGGVNLWYSASGAYRMGAPSVNLAAGAQLRGELALNILKSDVPLPGGRKISRLEVVASGDVSPAFHMTFEPGNASFGFLAPFSGMLGVRGVLESK